MTRVPFRLSRGPSALGRPCLAAEKERVPPAPAATGGGFDKPGLPQAPGTRRSKPPRLRRLLRELQRRPRRMLAERPPRS